MSLTSNQHSGPAEEEDISRAGVYHDEVAPKLSGSKGKQRADNPFSNEDESSSDEEDSGEKKYPPNIDDEEESRRVAENLRQWEQAERQRRKAARDSQISTASSSLVGDVTRKASLLWPGRRRSQQGPPRGPGTHHKLRDSEEEVALDELDTRLSAPPTPEPDNPFATPAASTLSLNNPQGSAIMQESDSANTLAEEPSAAPAAKKPSLGRNDSARAQSPPKPLDLPAPRSPPPRTETPHANRPPEPIPPPRLQHVEEEEAVPEKRWWTDWLCGCKESGDSQAGRTNPFE